MSSRSGESRNRAVEVGLPTEEHGFERAGERALVIYASFPEQAMTKTLLSCFMSRRYDVRTSAMKRSRFIPAEVLEPRMLLSGSGLMVGTPMVGLTTNTAPTVAQAIRINDGAAVTGKSATLAVLGADDGGETNLKYTWSVASAPAGGMAAFSVNGSNGAKSAVATFNKAGTYGITVKIVDAKGLYVTTSKSVVVSATVTGLRLTTGSQVITSGTPVSFTGVSEAFAAQGVDQFGNTVTVPSGWTWTMTTIPTDATRPVVAASGGNVTVTYRKAGAYTLAVQLSSGSTALTGRIAINVNQSVSSLRNTSGTPVVVTGTSVQLAVPTFIDQFGNAWSPTPALTWATYSGPKGAPAVTYTTVGGVTTATFGQVGSYYITGYVTSMRSASFVDVITVNQTSSSFVLTPNTASVFQGCNQQFSAQGLDQFGKAMTGVAPTVTWSASAGTISTAGLFTAPGVSTTATITAQNGSAKGTATVTVQGAVTFQNAALGSLVASLDADGSINRADMMQILSSVAANGPVTASELSDLKLILSEATALKMPDYVAVLASDVINGSLANAKFQGKALGNLTVGSSGDQLNMLVGKWFMGTDVPALCNTSLVYKQAAGSLFPHTPSHLDEHQGMLGDCYFISALGTLADSNPAAVQNMFLDNGDGTFTVRFYTGPYGTIYNYSDGSISAGFSNNAGTADYVTVNRMLPAGTTGTLAYADYGSNVADPNNALWIPLAEKAYAQWNETGKEGRDGLNAYASIQGGWMATVDAQVLGHNGTDYIMTSTSKQVAIAALAAHQAVTIGTLSFTGTKYGLYATHAYAITGYNASTDTFTLYNPWGTNQPGQLTWSQLQASCSQMAVCSTTGVTPISSSAVHA